MTASSKWRTEFNVIKPAIIRIIAPHLLLAKLYKFRWSDFRTFCSMRRKKLTFNLVEAIMFTCQRSPIYYHSLSMMRWGNTLCRVVDQMKNKTMITMRDLLFLYTCFLGCAKNVCIFLGCALPSYALNVYSTTVCKIRLCMVWNHNLKASIFAKHTTQQSTTTYGLCCRFCGTIQ